MTDKQLQELKDMLEANLEQRRVISARCISVDTYESLHRQYTQQIAELTAKRCQLEAEYARAPEMIAKLDADIASLREQIDTARATLTTSKIDRLAALRAEMEALEAEIANPTAAARGLEILKKEKGKK